MTNTSVAAGTYGEVGVNRALTAGDTFVVPKITLDEKGRATSAESVTLSIPGVAWLGAFDITADSAIAPGASGSVSASCPPGSLTLDVRAATPNLHFYYRSDVGFMLQNDKSFQIEATWVVGHTHCFQL
ncbi:hypothetical protein FACS189437_08400 [Bacteroidia bacterium]|nr:hypothetical protein FACS189437_08400 [Bacteroidia bacterium]